MFRVGISFLGFLEFSFHSFLKSKEKVVQLHFRFHHLHRRSWRTQFLPKNWRTLLRNRKTSLVTTRISQKMRSWQRSNFLVWFEPLKSKITCSPYKLWPGQNFKLAMDWTFSANRKSLFIKTKIIKLYKVCWLEISFFSHILKEIYRRWEPATSFHISSSSPTITATMRCDIG